MKSDKGMKNCWFAVVPLILVLPAVILTGEPKGIRSHVVIWDTVTPVADAVEVGDRNLWQAVPTDLIALEENPSAAAADPSHYGREYVFSGDGVVENEHLVAAFVSKTGRVVVYSKADLQKRIEVVPLGLKGKSGSIDQCRIVHNTGDEAVLEVSFSGAAGKDLTAIFSFGKTGIVGIKPVGGMRGVSLLSPIEYGVVPDFLSDDLVFDPEAYPANNRLCIPCGNVFMGLLQGENDVLVVTSSDSGQRRILALGGSGGQRLIESVDFESGGRSVYFGVLSAAGIWHEEELKPTYLEKDIASAWKRPFEAKWTTQLIEGKVKTTYTFRGARRSIWRGAVGSFVYPVWFDGDTAMYRLGKKILPRGKSVVYFLEVSGADIPVLTPVEVMKVTLGMDACEAILDVAGRRLRTHHRRGAAGIRRACTCGCTAAIEAVFKAEEEVEKREYVEGAVDDMVYFVRRHVARINEYQGFARSMIEFLEQAGRADGELKPYLEGMAEIVREIPEDYDRAKENMKTLEYTDELARQTKALAQREIPGTLKACLELCKKWRSMGGAQDDVLAQAHRVTRKLFQEAGYRCVDNPKAAEIAGQIRETCRKCLRNPDGYEIWANY